MGCSETDNPSSGWWAPDAGHGSVPVPQAVLEGLEAVRASGRTNMLDWARVAELAVELGRPEVAAWMHGHMGDYIRGIFEGFRTEENQS